jgi:lactoylglutathione lyase
MAALYETHLPVSDLGRSTAFYRDVVGLIPAFSQPERGVGFLWVGSRERGMVGLWEPGSAYGWKSDDRHPRHFAISVQLGELFASIPRLQNLGTIVTGFDAAVASEPSVIGWMPSAQVYFNDPDGHVLEFISILPDKPMPSFFGCWSDWQKQRLPRADPA